MNRILLIFAALLFFQVAHAQEKEWTMLVFLNGHNNLDPFGDLNVNQMEQYGSTDQINFVVQRASTASRDTKRLYITRGQNPNVVESQVVESLPRVDMGDYKNLIDFVFWGMQHYPAKKYFVAVWNHGSGWHTSVTNGIGQSPTADISFDDYTGNKITTTELGYAMNYVAFYTGQKIELYGSDACLMQMVEIANEMKWGVNYVVASQELEPGDGWPYHYFIERWIQNPYINGGELGKIMTEEYARYYKGQKGITLSVIDLQYFDALVQSMTVLKNELLNVADKRAIKNAAAATQGYYYSDYRDLQHFLQNLGVSNIAMNKQTIADVQNVLNYTIINSVSSSENFGTYGLSVWLPTNRNQYESNKNAYSGISFEKETGWSQLLSSIVN